MTHLEGVEGARHRGARSEANEERLLWDRTGIRNISWYCDCGRKRSRQALLCTTLLGCGEAADAAGAAGLKPRKVYRQLSVAHVIPVVAPERAASAAATAMHLQPLLAI
jgi:hypothetical protein